MATRSALAGAATAAVVVAAIGNPAAVSAARDLDDRALGATLTGFAGWDVADQPADVVAPVAVRLGTTLVMVALLCALAGRAGARPAALLGGWGATVVAAAAGGAVAYVYQVVVVLDGRTLDATYLDGLVLAANAGAAFGTWTGWLVGGAVALTARPAIAAVGADALGDVAHHRAAPTATTTAPGQIAEPPPPWWAPTRGAGDHIVPGPTAFPPGGLGHHSGESAVTPWAGVDRERPAPGATVEMTTASGDPHPSDPDGTRPAGLPPQPAAGTGAGATGITPPGGDQDAEDADATTALPPEAGAADRTLPTPRPPD
ncbi:MAG TPA: hypothetical protein VFP06_20090 [Acidimicrobiales bacterium]|nr:hypothetical protein [Acidimicrobiales bacterium]